MNFDEQNTTKEFPVPAEPPLMPPLDPKPSDELNWPVIVGILVYLVISLGMFAGSVTLGIIWWIVTIIGVIIAAGMRENYYAKHPDKRPPAVRNVGRL